MNFGVVFDGSQSFFVNQSGHSQNLFVSLNQRVLFFKILQVALLLESLI